MNSRFSHQHETVTLDALRSALEALPAVNNVELEESHPSRLDAAIRLHLAGKELLLHVEVKKAVYPRDTSALLWQFNRSRHEAGYEWSTEMLPLVAAESISVGARDVLRRERIGYFDTGGSLFLPASHAYVDIERPVPRAFEKSLSSIFTGKRAQVLHALLIHHREWLGTLTIAELAHVSAGTASETLGELERLGWVSAEGSGPTKTRRLTEPGDLLDEFGRQMKNTRHRLARRRYYVRGGSGMSLATRVSELCERFGVDFALTQEAGAQCYAPLLSSIARVACRMVPGSGMDHVLAELEARIVHEGANLEIIESVAPGDMLFTERRDSLRLASPVQVYLDLLRSEGRAKEMGDYLRKEVLGY